MTYIVCNECGFRRFYETLEDAIRYHRVDFLYYKSLYIIDSYDHQRVDPVIITNIANRQHAEYLKRIYLNYYGKYKFRCGPVPKIHKGVKYSYHRHPKTHQELKHISNIVLDEDVIDYKIKIRKKRNNLPTYWDDIERKDYKDRNWKRYRKTQWKE